MTGIDFDCPCCRKTFRGTDGTSEHPWPALGFRRPDPYLELTLPELHHADATDDLCWIARPDRTDFFVRAVMTIPIRDDPARQLDYGPWVSIGESDFLAALEHVEDPGHRAVCAGRLATALPDYDEVTAVPVLVRARGLARPEIVPDPDFDHPLVRDVQEGITRAEAELRIRAFLLRDPPE